MSKFKSQAAIKFHLNKRTTSNPESSSSASHLTISQRNYLESEWEKHQIQVFEYLMRGTRNYEDALDLSSEVWTKVLASFHTFRGNRASIKAWIFKISVNTVNDYYRHKTKRKETSLDSPGFPELPGQVWDQPDVAFQLAQLSEIIQQAFALLPEEQRNILLLRYDRSMSPAQVAAILEIPVGTVYSRCYNSKKNLLMILRHLGYEGALNHEL